MMTRRALNVKAGLRATLLLSSAAVLGFGVGAIPAQDMPSKTSAPPLGGAPRALKLPPISDTTLPNGLVVRIVEDHRFPLVTMRLSLKFGTASDPTDLPGLTAAMAELLTEGTASRNSRQIADELASIGGSLDTFASPDAVSVNGSSLSDYLPRLSSLVADAVMNPSFPESEVSLRKENLKQELAQNRAQPAWLARERFSREIYGSSPYAVVSATEASIEKLDRETIAGFHRKMVSPGAAILVVVGDVDRASALREITARFGSWSGQAPAKPSFPTPPSRTEREVYFVDRPGSVQSDIRVGNLGIQRKDPLYFPAVIMDGILGGGAASRLFLIVREEKGFTYDAHSEYVRRVNGSDWSAVTEVRTEVTKPALEEVLKQVERMRREKVTDKELAAAKSFATGVFTLQVERAASLADMLADQKLYDLPADELETYVSRINAVTADEVLKASQAVCDTSRAAVVVVGDGAKLKGDLGSFGKIVAFDTEGKPKSVAP